MDAPSVSVLVDLDAYELMRRYVRVQKGLHSVQELLPISIVEVELFRGEIRGYGPCVKEALLAAWGIHYGTIERVNYFDSSFDTLYQFLWRFQGPIRIFVLKIYQRGRIVAQAFRSVKKAQTNLRTGILCRLEAADDRNDLVVAQFLLKAPVATRLRIEWETARRLENFSHDLCHFVHN